MAAPRILLVDGPDRYIESLLTPLRERIGGGELVLVGTGQEAMKIMERERFQIVIADLQLTDMNGAQLFKHLHQHHPAAIRILISDPQGNDKVLQSVAFAHRSLSRSCTSDDLRQVILKSARMRHQIDDKLIRRQITRIRSLPSLPRIYYDLADELQSDDPSIKSIAAIIVKDVAITTKMLQIINSAFFGLPTRVSTPLQAVALLGMDKISDLTLAASIFTMFDTPPMGSFNLQGISNHGLQIGYRARTIAKRLELPDQVVDEAMLAGIVHDVGKLVELAFLRPQLKKALSRSRKESKPFHVAERDELGVTHGQIGAHLLALWGLPDPLIEAAAFHHEPMLAGEPELGVLTAVHLADAFAQDSSLSSIEIKDIGFDRRYLDKLQLTHRLEELRDIDLVPQG